MAVPSELQESLSKFRMAEIMEKIAGNTDNLHVEIQQVKFTIRNQKFEIDGKVDFNVIHKTANPHATENR